MFASIPYPQFDPVALTIPIPFEPFGWEGIPVRWYGLAYLAGFLLGWWYCARLARRSSLPPTPQQVGDFLTWTVVGVVLGGRLGFVLFYEFDRFVDDPSAILRIWDGGMAFHGGLLGMVVAILLFGWSRRIDPFAIGDMVAAAVPIGLFFGRIANFINNELWGRPSDLPWAVDFPIPAEWQSVIPQVPRHPSQIYEALLEGVVIFTVLAVMIHRPSVRARPGMVAGTFLILYGCVRFLVEFVRQPDPGVPLLFDLFSRGQQLSVPMVLAGLIMLEWARRRTPRTAPA
ncbi:MAG: prolipoprotein diacylglyceryl transferase [Rhodospirillaceae bacterium]|nr:prolipoprotein diacylglyceryl transferase [Rhodospirillaceae bacterium]